MDPMFWCSKLHFHLSRISFYNYPYIFGYLFALGVYAQKEKLGADFFPAYKRLLRDTGRMPAEKVAMEHLGADLTKPDFWRDSLAIVEHKVEAFEHSVKLLFKNRK
jgi:oligoendopeptidase F